MKNRLKKVEQGIKAKTNNEGEFHLAYQHPNEDYMKIYDFGFEGSSSDAQNLMDERGGIYVITHIPDVSSEEEFNNNLFTC